MTAPSKQLTITEQARLQRLTWEVSGVVPDGRVMLCKGRKVVGFRDIEQLGQTIDIDARATRVCLSATDFADVRAWMGVKA